MSAASNSPSPPAGELPPSSLDARDLVTVAGNLLDNAFDAAADSEERHVWADFVAADGELIITVADSGPGIDTEEIDAIFHLGVSAKAAPAGSGGRGLRLGAGAPGCDETRWRPRGRIRRGSDLHGDIAADCR